MRNQHPLSILIIDDNPGDQILLEENLRSTELAIEKFIFAGSLGEGISALTDNNPSLVFLDLFLPDSHGLQSLSELIKVNAKIPIIIYSGLSDTRTALEAITLGAQDFLIKGDYSNTLLEKTVSYSIERKNNLDELEKSNSKYELLSKVTHDMIWDWDLVTDNVYRNNEGWKKIFRTKPGEEIKTTEDWPKKIHPEDREEVACLVKRALESKDQNVFEAEFRITRDDGTIGYLEDRGYIIRDDAGVAIRIIGASHDITERKNAEAKVILSEQRFKSLVQNSSDLLAIIGAEGNYIYVSPTSFNILGYPPEFFIGKNAFSFIHPDDQETTAHHLARITEVHLIVVPLFRFLNAKGEWRWIESTVTNMLDDKAIGGIVVNSRDVTERKIADDEIAKLSMVAKNTRSGIFILDSKREILWVNDAFTTITEYTLEEVKGKRPSILLSHPDAEPIDFPEIFAKIHAGETFEAERLNRTKSGKPIYVWLQLQTLFNTNGEATHYFGMQTDITLQKELEAKVELEKVLKQKQITEAVYTAQESERSEIGRELHDNVNQLLGAIKLYINMAKTDDAGRDSLLNDASEFTLTAIEEIRKLSKTLITPLIKEIGLIESIKGLAEEIMIVHPIRIQVSGEGMERDSFNHKFKLNVFRICQEQINNTIKHAQAANAWISISESGDKVYLSISDDGVGFDTTIRRNGVGITNIKSRCELYNGLVTLTSQVGSGTNLLIEFDRKNLL